MERSLLFIVLTTVSALLLAGCLGDGSSSDAEPDSVTFRLSERGVRAPVSLRVDDELRTLSPGEEIRVTAKTADSEIEWRIADSHGLQACHGLEVDDSVRLYCLDKRWFKTDAWYITDGTPDDTRAVHDSLMPVRDWVGREIHFKNQRLLQENLPGLDMTEYWLYDGTDAPHPTNWPSRMWGATSDGDSLYLLSGGDNQPTRIDRMTPELDSPSLFMELPELPEGDVYTGLAVINQRLLVHIAADPEAKEAGERSNGLLSIALDGSRETKGRFKFHSEGSSYSLIGDKEVLLSWPNEPAESALEPAISVIRGDGDKPEKLALPADNVTHIQPLGFINDKLLMRLTYTRTDAEGTRDCEALYLKWRAQSGFQEINDFCDSHTEFSWRQLQLVGNNLFFLGRAEDDPDFSESLTPAIIPYVDRFEKLFSTQVRTMSSPYVEIPDAPQVVEPDQFHGEPLGFRWMGDWLFLYTLESQSDQQTARIYTVDPQELTATELVRGRPLEGSEGVKTTLGQLPTFRSRILFGLVDDNSNAVPWSTNGTLEETMSLQ